MILIEHFPLKYNRQLLGLTMEIYVMYHRRYPELSYAFRIKIENLHEIK